VVGQILSDGLSLGFSYEASFEGLTICLPINLKTDWRLRHGMPPHPPPSSLLPTSALSPPLSFPSPLLSSHSLSISYHYLLPIASVRSSFFLLTLCPAPLAHFCSPCSLLCLLLTPKTELSAYTVAQSAFPYEVFLPYGDLISLNSSTCVFFSKFRNFPRKFLNFFFTKLLGLVLKFMKAQTSLSSLQGTFFLKIYSLEGGGGKKERRNREGISVTNGREREREREGRGGGRKRRREGTISVPLIGKK
jgi:hypothetical protein